MVRIVHFSNGFIYDFFFFCKPVGVIHMLKTESRNDYHIYVTILSTSFAGQFGREITSVPQRYYSVVRCFYSKTKR